jgi:hypothetical protein
MSIRKPLNDRSRLAKLVGFFVPVGVVFPWVYYRRNISNEKTAYYGVL